MIAAASSVQLDDVAGVVEQIATLAGALVVLGGIAWRFVLAPKVNQLLANQQRTVAHVQEALVDEPGTLKSDARIAANAARELPQLRDELRQLLHRVDAIEDARVVERLQLLEFEGDNHGRRIGSLEQSVIAWLGGQLNVERAERLADHAERERAQNRADTERNRRQAHENG